MVLEPTMITCTFGSSLTKVKFGHPVKRAFYCDGFARIAQGLKGSKPKRQENTE